MKLQLYTIKDTKTVIYNPPFSAPNDEMAKRILSGVVNNPETKLSQFPADYEMYRVGEFDDNSNQLTSSESVFICNAQTMQVRRPDPEAQPDYSQNKAPKPFPNKRLPLKRKKAARKKPKKQ